MIDILHREFIYLWFYCSVQLEQIFRYWVFGIVLGSVISVFVKDKIHNTFRTLSNKPIGMLGIIAASLLGIASPLCMYGTIPIAASFSRSGMKDDWLAAFMMSSILLNPQLFIYTMSLGKTAVIIRFLSAFLCGVVAGLLVRVVYKKISFFDFTSFKEEPTNHDRDPKLLIRLLKNIGRNVKATGGYFLLGILLSALFQRYVPSDAFANLFGSQKGFGVLMAATIGVPLYVCGGGTIPLLMDWLASGMSMGAAAAFMVTGPATKITNLGALKIVLGNRHFLIYLAYITIFALISGFIVNIIV
jgi:uncharacterized membrane protein YraQ (UPF0718 family)